MKDMDVVTNDVTSGKAHWNKILADDVVIRESSKKALA